jgi:WD40 repeat protein
VIIMVRRWSTAKALEPSGGVNHGGERGHPVRLTLLAPGLPLLLFALMSACFLMGEYHERMPATVRGVLEGSTFIDTMSLTPDAMIVAASDSAGTVQLWYPRIDRRQLFLSGRHKHTRCVALAPDAKTVAIGGVNSTVSVCDVASGKMLWSASTQAADILTVAFSPDGTTLAAGGDDEVVYVWDRSTHRLEAQLAGHTQAVTAVAFAPDGRTLISGSQDGTIRCWDAVTNQARWVIPVRSNVVAPTVRYVRFSPDGKMVATSASRDASVRLWCSATGQALMSLRREADFIGAVEFTPDGKGLVAGDSRGDVTIWDLESRRPRTSWNAHGGLVTAVAYSADGRTLASAGEGTIKLWQLSDDGNGPPEE